MAKIERLKKYGWWGLIATHIITPFLPFTFPIRVGLTAFMATQTHWLKVVLVANAASTASLTLQYLIYHQLGSSGWSASLEHQQVISKIIQALDAHMFLTLVGLTLSPLPETLWPLLASMRDYPLWKFALAMWCGKLTHTVPMALGGVSLAWFWLKIKKLPPEV